MRAPREQSWSGRRGADPLRDHRTSRSKIVVTTKTIQIEKLTPRQTRTT
jgi:hypothetical protein